MWLDVAELDAFYRTPLGRVARLMIRRRLRAMWPDTTGKRVLAFGYGTPYLGAYRDGAERVAGVMPAAQGVIAWPSEGRRLVALSEEAALPFADNSFDLALLVHALESSEQLRPMLREVWRVLAGNGRVLVIAPNRRGLWARLERTPFGHGHPYSPRQLEKLLVDCLYTPLRTEAALYMPPVRGFMMLRLATAWERLGARWKMPFAGVLLMEAEKRVYAATAVPAGNRRLRQRAGAGALYPGASSTTPLVSKKTP